VLLTGNAKWVFALVLLVVVATVEATPSIGGTGAKVVARAASLSPYAESPAIDKVEPLINSSNPAMAHIAADLLKPPAELTSRTALPPGTKLLPAIPPALFMALSGFLCVTLVRDRKVWLAVATTLLWAGQVGINAMPKLASHLANTRQIKQRIFLNHTYAHKSKNVDQLRCDIDGAQYAGLLHYLQGIPAARNTKYEIRNTSQAPQSAITSSSHYVIPANICLAKIVRPWRFCFLPAFIVDSIPRGPPLFLTC
jgi:hypothetical protein